MKITAKKLSAILASSWLLLLAMFFATDFDVLILFSIGVLSIAQFMAIRIWGESQLIDPVQAVIMMFYFWFGIGPVVLSLQKLVVSDVSEFNSYINRSPEPVLIVAFGLILLAATARFVKQGLSNKVNNIFQHSYLSIEENNVLLMLIGVGIVSSVIIRIASSVGYGSIEIDHLGGSITSSGWIWIMSKASLSLEIGISGYFYLLLRNGGKPSWLLNLVFSIGISYFLFSAYYSGWKVNLVKPLLYLMIAYLSKKERLPVYWMVGSALLYIIFIEPFVSGTRTLTEISGGSSSKDRVEVIKDFDLINLFGSFSLEKINLESPFRNIYRCCQDICEMSSLTIGPWSGTSIEHGILASLPRFLFPNKPLLNVGNFFAVRLGLIEDSNITHNVSITMPFEFVGNYGLAASCIGFFILALVLGLVVAILLPKHRPHASCINGILILMAIQGSEMPLGHMIALIRDSIFSFGIVWAIIAISRRRVAKIEVA